MKESKKNIEEKTKLSEIIKRRKRKKKKKKKKKLRKKLDEKENGNKIYK